MSHVELPHGTVYYQESGAGAPVVFLHGYLMGAGLWAPVVRLLEGEFRCLIPELPFGAHPAPMRRGADLTAAGSRGGRPGRPPPRGGRAPTRQRNSPLSRRTTGAYRPAPMR